MVTAGPQHIWRRHDLLRIRPDAWEDIFAALPKHARVEVLSSWAKKGHPFIVRRYLQGESHDHIPAGAPLPPYLGKQRITISVTSGSVAGRVSPVSLHAAGDQAPPAWAATICALLDLGNRYETEAHIIGSLLWQHLTGLSYLTDTSDLDLLWPSSAVCRPFLQELAVIDRVSPVRLDGEVFLPDGSTVNWRELHGCLEGAGEKTVLVKSIKNIRIQAAGTILADGQPL